MDEGRKTTINVLCGRTPLLLPYLVLFDVVWSDVQADADGYEDETDHKESRQHGARREDGLPGR